MKFAHAQQGELDALVTQFAEIAAGQNAHQALQRIENYQQRLKEGVFRIAVVGEIKKGKSSLINALLGVEAAPVASDVATSVVYKVVWGPNPRAVVHFLPQIGDDGEIIPTRSEKIVTFEELADWGTEDGNPGNRKGVDHIRIEHPDPWLQRGVEILDTPGLGGLFRHHAMATWGHIPTADGVFFVLDSVEALMSADEAAFLRKILPITPRITFFQTKIDLVNKDNWQVWKERNLDIIADVIDRKRDTIDYFPISAKLKSLADSSQNRTALQRSGFLEVSQHLSQDLLQQKEDELTRNALDLLNNEIRSIRSEMEKRIHIASMENRQKMETLDQELQQDLDCHDEWHRHQLKDEVDKLRDRLSDLKTRTRNLLTDQLKSTSNGPVVSKIMAYFQQNEQITPQQIDANYAQVQNACIDQCGEILSRIQRDFDAEADRILRDTVDALGVSWQRSQKTGSCTSLGRPNEDADDSLGIRQDHRVMFDQVRTTVSGGVIGLAALGMLFAGPVGAIISVIGGLFAAWFSNDSWKHKQRKEALSRLQKKIGEVVADARQQATRQFDKRISDIERESRRISNDASDEIRGRLRARRDELIDTKKRTKHEAEQHIVRLQADLHGVNTLLERCQRQLARLSPGQRKTPRP